MSPEYVISLENGVGRNPATRLLAPVSLTIGRREHVAIVGPNGGGKSLLVDLLTSRMPLREGTIRYHFPTPAATPAAEGHAGVSATSAYGNILVVKFEDAIGTVENPYYYQQRFNSQDRDESPLVRDTLPAGAATSPLMDELRMTALMDKRMVLLSSGEMRRYHLFKQLLSAPQMLIIDNPFIGLDAPMREQLHGIFRRLIAAGRVQIVMLLSSEAEVPDYVTHVVTVADRRVGSKLRLAEFRAAAPQPPLRLADSARRALVALPPPAGGASPAASTTGDEVVAIRRLTLDLGGGRRLYGGLDWTVRRGERWALLGRNGSGKSTLLSLICADHPAAYACDISLFGRRRGTGESIWDIKRHIGFVSPEFHRAYRENVPALDIVASGLHDSVGLYRRPQPQEAEACRWWMTLFGIDGLADRLFLTLSSGEQRLCLLARAFVKDPDLLILDEPFHGIDSRRRTLVRDIIDAFCSRPGKTLIIVSHYEEDLPDGILLRLELTAP